MINGGSAAFFWQSSTPPQLEIQLESKFQAVLSQCEELIKSRKPVDIKAQGKVKIEGAIPNILGRFFLGNVLSCK